MKVAVIGGNGQLGSDLVEIGTAVRHEVHALTHAELEITNVDSVKAVLEEIQPDIILNTAAFHSVPVCEQEPEKAYAINSLGALNVAKVAEDLGAVNVYYSTDYVFDGTKGTPYVEMDQPNPLNVYANTKLGGEYYTLNYSSYPYVFRVSGIYGKVPCRAKGGACGLYHLTSEGQCSWYEFAKVIFKTMKFSIPLHSATVADFPMVVKRPTYSVLENARLKEQGLASLPHWKDSLVAFLEESF